METTPPPSHDVLSAFGLADATLSPLAGRVAQSAWRANDVVLKRVQDRAESEWTAVLFDAIEEDGFRVYRPVRAHDGSFVRDDWVAWHWLPGTHVTDRWHDVVAATRALHREVRAAAERAGLSERPSWLDDRTHRWANAERSVWGGAPLPAHAHYDVPEFAHFERAAALGSPLTEDERLSSQVVHGDPAGNVLADPASPTLAFIDMSPGWRPAFSVEMQIAVEAVAWHGCDEALIDDFATNDDARVEMARVIAWRFLCGLQAVAEGLRFSDAEVARFVRVLDRIGA